MQITIPTPNWKAIGQTLWNWLPVALLAGIGGYYAYVHFFGGSGPTPGPDALALQVTRQGHAGRIWIVQATTKGQQVMWHCAGPSADYDLIPDDDAKSVAFCSGATGDFTISAYTAVANKPVSPVSIVITNGSPEPPPPPPPPPMPSPLTQSLQIAFNADTDTNKSDMLAKLAGLYRQGATTANDATIATAGALLQTMHAAAVSLIGQGLPKTRAAIELELDANLPTNAAQVLDAPTRTQIVSEFQKVAEALGEVK